MKVGFFYEEVEDLKYLSTGLAKRDPVYYEYHPTPNPERM